MNLSFVTKSNKLPTASALMRTAVGTAFAAAKGPLLADMQRRTPVDTGALRSSEAAESDDQSLRLTAGTDHAIYVHQGTRSMSARPFMRDAIEAGVPTVVAELSKAAEAAFR